MPAVLQPSPQPSATTPRADAAWSYTDLAHTFDAKSGLVGLTGIINVGSFRLKLHCTYDPRRPPTLSLWPLPETSPATDAGHDRTSRPEPSRTAPRTEASTVAAMVALFSAAAKTEPSKAAEIAEASTVAARVEQFSAVARAKPSKAAGTAQASLHAVTATPRDGAQAASPSSGNPWKKVKLSDDRSGWQPVDPDYLMRETNELTSDWHTALARQNARNRLVMS